MLFVILFILQSIDAIHESDVEAVVALYGVFDPSITVPFARSLLCPNQWMWAQVLLAQCNADGYIVGISLRNDRYVTLRSMFNDSRSNLGFARLEILRFEGNVLGSLSDVSFAAPLRIVSISFTRMTGLLPKSLFETVAELRVDGGSNFDRDALLRIDAPTKTPQVCVLPKNNFFCPLPNWVLQSNCGLSASDCIANNASNSRQDYLLSGLIVLFFSSTSFNKTNENFKKAVWLKCIDHRTKMVLVVRHISLVRSSNVAAAATARRKVAMRRWAFPTFDFTNRLAMLRTNISFVFDQRRRDREAALSLSHDWWCIPISLYHRFVLVCSSFKQT